MANKYVDVSATYNGDGTTSAQAASAGAAGAWNSLIQVLSGSATGAYGTINAGDTVYVRTAASSSNLGQALTASLSFFTATNAFVVSIATKEAPITIVFDNGVIWPGDQGTFKFTAASAYGITAKEYFNLLATKTSDTIYGFHFDSTWAGGTAGVFNGASGCYEGILFSTPKSTAVGVSGYRYNPCLNSSATAVYRNCRWDVGTFFSASHPLFSGIMNYATVLMYGCIVDVTGANTTFDNTIRFLELTNGDNHIEFHGLRVLGTPSNGYHKLIQASATGNLRRTYFYDCDLGNLYIPNLASSESGVGIRSNLILMSGINGEPFDFREDWYLGVSQWRAGQNYPTLSAQLPDGDSTPWSIQVYQQWAKPGAKEFICTDICKLYTAVADVRTMTFELLIKNTWNSAPTNNQWWVDLYYTDATTGQSVFITTKSTAGALASSTAAWSATVYGGNSYDKRKITVTTPSSIKQGSKIRARIVSNFTPTNATDFYFIDPEFSVI